MNGLITKGKGGGAEELAGSGMGIADAAPVGNVCGQCLWPALGKKDSVIAKFIRQLLA